MSDSTLFMSFKLELAFI